MKKRIGIDFDNTIVTYDEVFYKYALQEGLISPDVKKNKKAIRDAIRGLPDGNTKWTELQGMVYGTHMEEALPVPGIENFLAACKKNFFEVFIISHKTIMPFKGPKVNLQQAARQWLKNRNFNLTDQEVIFEETLEGKLDQISQRQCAYFIDDLTEVLAHPGFPQGVKKMLYGQKDEQDFSNDIMQFKDWDEIKKYFFA